MRSPANAAPARPLPFAIAAVLALTFLAYCGTLRFQFVYDDVPQIVLNRSVQSWAPDPLHRLGSLFSQDVFNQLHPGQGGDYYRPIFVLWLLLNYTLFGATPWLWHLTTVLAHVLATFLTYRLARRLAGDDVAALTAALVFGLHPVHIEGVAWVSGVTEPLMTVFFVASFLCYLNARQDSNRRYWWLAASLALYALAALSKETGVVLPAVVLAYEALVPDGNKWLQRARRALTASFVYFLVAAAYLLARYHALHGLAKFERHPLPAILFTLPEVLVFYLRMLLWPFGLSVFYSYRLVRTPGWSTVALPLLLTIAAVVALTWIARRSRLAAFLIAWIFLTLLPALVGIADFLEMEMVHDRYLYLPSVGFAILLGIGLRKLPAAKLEIFGFPASQASAAMVVIAALGIGTAIQSASWRDDHALFTHGLKYAPRNPLLLNHLANDSYKRGRPDEAVGFYRTSLEADPNLWHTNFALALTLYDLRRFPEAEQALKRAAAIDPRNPNQYYYLGLVQAATGRDADAEASLRAAAERAGSMPGFHRTLALLLVREGKLAEARDQFQAELAIDPNSPAREEKAQLDQRLAQQ